MVCGYKSQQKTFSKNDNQTCKKKKKILLKNCFLLQKSSECDLEITLSNNSDKNIRMFELKSTYNEFFFLNLLAVGGGKQQEMTTECGKNKTIFF